MRCAIYALRCLQADLLLMHTGTAFCLTDLNQSLGEPPLAAGVKRKRQRMTADQKGTTAATGANFVVRLLEHPCLAMRFVAPGAVALLEQPWALVHSQLQAPLYRHRYGT